MGRVHTGPKLDSGFRLRRKPNWKLSGTENLPAGCSDAILSTCPFLLPPKALSKYTLEMGGGWAGFVAVTCLKGWNLLEQLPDLSTVGMLHICPVH